MEEFLAFVGCMALIGGAAVACCVAVRFVARTVERLKTLESDFRALNSLACDTSNKAQRLRGAVYQLAKGEPVDPKSI